MPTTLTLPYPPSVNSIWRFSGKSAYISKQYADWKKAADASFTLQKRKLTPVKGAFTIFLTFPEGKRRKNTDLDNRIKVVLDAIERFKIIENDAKCDSLTASWGTTDDVLISIFEAGE